MILGDIIYKQTRFFIKEIARGKIILQAVLVGLFSGLIVVLFRLAIGFIGNFVYPEFIRTDFHSRLIFFPFICALGGLISGLFVKAVPEIKGSGIPYVKMVLTRMGCFIRLRSIITKFFGGAIAIGTGMSLGREGPSVQLGAGAGEFVGKLFKLKGTDKDKLIAAGAGSAIAATFNAPVAGTIFVLEELVNKFSSSLLFPVLIATVSADSLSRYLLGNKPCFVIPQNMGAMNFADVIPCVILGAFAAVFGVLFTKTIFFNDKIFDKLKFNDVYKPAIAGLIVGIVGAFFPLVMGSGNEAVDFLLAHKLQIGVILFVFVLKLLLTPLCFGSGAVGGIFLPTLMLGSFLGYIVAVLLNFVGFQVDVVMFSVLGMGAFLSSVARTPITATVMVFEMTGSYHFILPIMLCSALADLIAEKMGHKPIYSMLIVNNAVKTGDAKLLADIKVETVMTKEIDYINSSDRFSSVRAKIAEKTFSSYPVLDGKKRLCGYITKSNIEDLIFQGADDSLEISKIMNPNPITVLYDENLYIAYFRLHSNNIHSLFVVDKFNTLKGIITREDIFCAIKNNQNC